MTSEEKNPSEADAKASLMIAISTTLRRHIPIEHLHDTPVSGDALARVRAEGI